jgi:pyruvate dehydrogenase E1 component beta subunit
MVPEEDYIIPLGEADVKREGKDVTIVTYGRMVKMSLDAAEELKAAGIDCEVIDIRTLAPLDINTIIASVKKTKHCLIVHEAVKFGGFGAEIASEINESDAFFYLDAPVSRLGTEHCPVPFNPTLEREVMPTVPKIVAAVKNLF